MTFQEWVSLFIREVRETGLLQWVAVGFGVAEVLLARANRIALYPAGIIATMVSAYLLFHAGLFAESALNLYYLVMSIYGWIYWGKRKDKPPVEVSWSSHKEWMVTSGISLGGGAVLYLILHHYTTSDVPFWDAIVASTAWAGMWLLARRKIENWILLNISNIIAVPLLFYKKMPLFAALTVFLFIVAVFGFFDWAKIYRKKHLVAE